MKKLNDNSVKLTEQQIAMMQKTLIAKLGIAGLAHEAKTYGLIRRFATVGEILKFKQIKESGEYKGLPYKDANGEIKITTGIKDFCPPFLGISYGTLQEGIQNLSVLGQEFLQKMDQTGLSGSHLRMLRQSSEEDRQSVMNNDDLDLNNKAAVKERIEEIHFNHKTELATEKQRADEAEQTVKAVRANSDEKQQELDQNKEIEAERKFSQEPWRYQATDALAAIINSRTSNTQGVNQIIDVLDGLREYDEKSRDLIAKTLLSEVQYNFQLVGNLTNDTFGALSGQYSPELPLDELYNLLHEQSGGAAGEMGEHENTISPEELAEMNK